MVSVIGRSRVPSPAAKIIACIVVKVMVSYKFSSHLSPFLVYVQSKVPPLMTVVKPKNIAKFFINVCFNIREFIFANMIVVEIPHNIIINIVRISTFYFVNIMVMLPNTKAAKVSLDKSR